uniref:BED-type domain-containing protein n=6 Tax=Oryza TaxID=4527 RepID=A0A0E0R617_ORYRU
MMAEVEATLLEGGIEWLAQTILENLDSEKLDEWILQVGLSDATEKLKAEMERVDVVVTAVRQRAIGNKLTRSLGRLRELLYDADNAVDELDYYRLQNQVQEENSTLTSDSRNRMKITDESTHNNAVNLRHWNNAELQAEAVRPKFATDISSSSGGPGGKRWSEVWKNFDITEHGNGKAVKKVKCIHCNTVLKCGASKGTSVLHKHLRSISCKNKRGASYQQPNLSSTSDITANSALTVEFGGSGSRKRMKIIDESTHNNAVDSRPWNKAECSSKIQQITGRLQDAIGAVSEVLKLHGSDFVGNSNYRTSTTTTLFPTSSLSPHKIYGRDAEKNAIMKIIADDSYDGVTVVPIVGIAGVGKTALAQLVYNDPIVKHNFDQVWVWVSKDYNEVMLTMEILDFVSQERHEVSHQRKESHNRISSFAKLQEILDGHMDIRTKKFLLVLDDVWDSMDDNTWNTLLVPLKSNRAKGNMILVTTRILSLAQRVGTVDPIKLGPLSYEDFWLFFKACAFGDENYRAHPSLDIIGRKIADKLNGNPLAAETAGPILRKDLAIDHWSNTLRDEAWKSLDISRGIMPSLKLSYDQLPYHLQQCFLYCSIFPSGYCFLGQELIHIWISQGFVHRNSSSKRLEEIGREYLSNLVNSGFFQPGAQTNQFTQVDKTSYVMCGLIHDFARMVSRTEYATIDNPQCNKMLPTIRHLSILTDSTHQEDPDCGKVEERIRNAVKPVKHLRTLVLIGQHNHIFLKSFKDIVQKEHHLRVLQISAPFTDIDPLLFNLVNPTHIRYIKFDDGALPLSVGKFYHLQVFDAGSESDLIIPNDMDNLVSLRHLVAAKQVFSSITSIGKMTSLQELNDFSVHNSLGLNQLQSLNQLVQLGVSGLETITTRIEACGARLRDKHNLEKLHLSSKDAKDGYDSGMSSENEYDTDMSSENETDSDIEPLMEGLTMADTNISPVLKNLPGIAREVLDGLEPHHSLKHLRISGYNGATSPTWFPSSLTCLQTLHLEKCEKWQRLPLERLTLLRKLVLIKMRNATEVSIPSVEELVLTELISLKACSCTSIRNLNDNLKVLKIKSCPALEVFPLFENYPQFEIEQSSWFSCLREITIYGCPHLRVHKPLPPSPNVEKLSITRVSTLPSIEGSSSGTLRIGFSYDWMDEWDESSDQMITLDDKVMAFRNLRFLSGLVICGCQNLTTISLDSLRQLRSLKSLEISNCLELFAPNVPSDTREDMAAADHNTLLCLKLLDIRNCGITGKWLSLLLQHMKTLQELRLQDCEQITGLSIGEEECGQPNLMSATETPSLGFSAENKLPRLPLNIICSLKKIYIKWCSDLTFHGSKDGLAGFTSLEQLEISVCPKLIDSLLHNDGNVEQANRRWLLPISLEELIVQYDGPFEMLQLCFPGNLTRLKKLFLMREVSLTSLQLHSCTALQELTIRCARSQSLNSLEGLQSLGNLRLLQVKGLRAHMGYLLPQSLEELCINNCFIQTLCPRFQMNLTCLKKLEVHHSEFLISLELQSCTALEELTIKYCKSLAVLEGLQFLYGLRSLQVHECPRLPPCLDNLSWQGHLRLEKLCIDDTSILTTSFCKHLTSLEYLKIYGFRSEEGRLTDEQERALQLLTTLQELQFISCDYLQDLPAGLHSLPSLKRLEIWGCYRIRKLPEKGLPPSLEELDIYGCSKELDDQCRTLGSKLKVKIDGSLVSS